jgi:PAS domain-containing protein
MAGNCGPQDEFGVVSPACSTKRNHHRSLPAREKTYHSLDATMTDVSRRPPRYTFDAAAEVEFYAVVRKARVKDLCIHGCYIAMREPFSKGASVRITIRTQIEFFQADAIVAHSTHGIGMGVTFRAISPPFLAVLQYWLSEAHEVAHKIVGGREIAKEKRNYSVPRVTEYLPDEVPKRIADSFKDDPVSVAPTYRTVVDSDRRYVRVSNAFCELVGYKREELIGRQYDDITAPPTGDIPTIFGLFRNLGYMRGLWTLVHRTGQRISIRYEAWVRPDSFIESKIEVVDSPTP